MSVPTRLRGRHVAITGGGRGIGAATAERLRREGALVTLGDIDVGAVEATAAGLGAVGSSWTSATAPPSQRSWTPPNRRTGRWMS